MANSRVSRGRKTQALVAEWYQERGWPEARSTPASLPGLDVTGMPFLAPEVKARTGFDPLGWVKQAAKNADDGIPFVVMRCNGQGEQSIGEWIVLRRLKDDTPLLQACFGRLNNAIPGGM